MLGLFYFLTLLSQCLDFGRVSKKSFKFAFAFCKLQKLLLEYQAMNKSN